MTEVVDYLQVKGIHKMERNHCFSNGLCQGRNHHLQVQEQTDLYIITII